ncbi:MAG: hypothetical protein H6582_01595 [Crocinitomicaceae bacterium]|nr:hypothetical protein [Crocinitomicaceae bacterium]
MSKPFQFKQFQIIQIVNAQKVGTDSVLLGAWTNGNFKRILDIRVRTTRKEWDDKWWGLQISI